MVSARYTLCNKLCWTRLLCICVTCSLITVITVLGSKRNEVSYEFSDTPEKKVIPSTKSISKLSTLDVCSSKYTLVSTFNRRYFNSRGRHLLRTLVGENPQVPVAVYHENQFERPRGNKISSSELPQSEGCKSLFDLFEHYPWLQSFAHGKNTVFDQVFRKYPYNMNYSARYVFRKILAQHHAIHSAKTPFVLYADADVIIHSKLDEKFDKFVEQHDVVVIERRCTGTFNTAARAQACIRKNKGRDHLLETGFISYQVEVFACSTFFFKLRVPEPYYYYCPFCQFSWSQFYSVSYRQTNVNKNSFSWVQVNNRTRTFIQSVVDWYRSNEAARYDALDDIFVYTQLLDKSDLKVGFWSACAHEVGKNTAGTPNAWWSQYAQTYKSAGFQYKCPGEDDSSPWYLFEYVAHFKGTSKDLSSFKESAKKRGRA